MRDTSPNEAADLAKGIAASAVYVQQSKQWQEILDLSQEIALQVKAEGFSDLLEKAEARDKKLTAFFEQTIDARLVSQVLIDVEEIKKQHTAVMKVLTHVDLQKAEEETSLLAVKQDLSASQENS